MAVASYAESKTHVVAKVRGLSLSLVAYTRALELCARMNYETEVLDFIDRIDECEVFYDLGACEGRFALYAAKRGLRCFAFEPEAENFRALTENISLNGDDARERITAINCAVGRYTGQATLQVGQPWAGGHHKTVAHQAERADLAFVPVAEQEIRVVALDEYILSANAPRPNFLKIDVDGSELAFVAGAAETLASPNVKGLIFDLCETDKSFQEIVSKLQQLGYRMGPRHGVPNNAGLFNVEFWRE